MSRLETALLALKAKLETVAGATVVRNSAIPQEVPDGGLIILRNGDPGEPEISMSPVRYHYQHGAEVEVFVQRRDDDERSAEMAALLESVGAALETDLRLGGAVDFMRWDAPAYADESITGAPTIAGAVVTVWLHFTTTQPLA